MREINNKKDQPEMNRVIENVIENKRDDQHSNPPTTMAERQRQRFVDKATKVSAKYLRRLAELPGDPVAMQPFFTVLSGIYVEMKNVAKPADTKIVGTYCVMVPDELIYAVGAQPVKLCSGSYTAFAIGDDLVPRDACPLIKAVMGFQAMEVMPIYDDCALMVVPITCDCKKKMAGMLKQRVPTYALHVPTAKSEDRDMEQYVQELYQLIPELEAVTGQTISYQSLAASIDAMGFAQYQMSKFNEFKKHVPALIKGTHAMALMNAFSYLPVEQWSQQLHILNQVVDAMVTNTGIDNNAAASALIEKMCSRRGINRAQVRYTMATGYSRKVFDIADDDISEITAHAYGVRLTAPPDYRPGMIIDIGGQDSKIIYLDSHYAVKNFTMNDKCAAGTGKFMEVIAQILETTIDQVGPLSLESKAPCDINSTCVVFAQSEVVSLVARKYDRRDILAGMHLSMAKRIIKMMKKAEKGGDILMTGGGALNIGVHKAFEEELMRDVYVARHPQFNGAIGAALIASERA